MSIASELGMNEVAENLGFANLIPIFKVKVQGNLNMREYDTIYEWDNILYTLIRLISNTAEVGYDPESDQPDGKMLDVLDIHLELRQSDVIYDTIWLATDESVVITRGDDCVVIAEIHEIKDLYNLMSAKEERFDRQNYLETYLVGAASSDRAVGLLAILKIAIN